jgi:hypothetical protein
MTQVLHVASRKGLFAFHENGGGWTAGPPAFLGQPVTAVMTDPRDGAIYAALNLGHFGVKLHRSDDGGRAWSELNCPAYPKAEDGAADAPSLDMIWTLVPGGADQPGVIWAGTSPGGLFVSRDGGESWALNDTLWAHRPEWFGGGYDNPGLHSILVDPRDSRRMVLGVSTGGVWTSEDAGETWTLGGQGLRAAYMPPDQAFSQINQDVHRLAASAADPDTIWCQHHNGVFRSKDGGRTFEEFVNCVPSVFGFAVAVHPEDPDTVWFAPAIKDELRVPVDGRMVVGRTRDGGASWEALDGGLPSPSYDLVYRHGLDVDPSGRRLAMGSTTGNLWISDDGGEAWALISAHLPPIAQVAFSSRPFD